jgi:hypothetical protein
LNTGHVREDEQWFLSAQGNRLQATHVKELYLPDENVLQRRRGNGEGRIAATSR